MPEPGTKEWLWERFNRAWNAGTAKVDEYGGIYLVWYVPSDELSPPTILKVAEGRIAQSLSPEERELRYRTVPRRAIDSAIWYLYHILEDEQVGQLNRRLIRDELTPEGVKRTETRSIDSGGRPPGSKTRRSAREVLELEDMRRRRLLVAASKLRFDDRESWALIARKAGLNKRTVQNWAKKYEWDKDEFLQESEELKKTRRRRRARKKN